MEILNLFWDSLIKCTRLRLERHVKRRQTGQGKITHRKQLCHAKKKQDCFLLAYKFWLSKNVVIRSLQEKNLPFFDFQSQSRSESEQAIYSGFIEIERPFVKWVLSIARVYTQSFRTENVVRFIIREYAGNVDCPYTGSKILSSADLFVFRVVELVPQKFLKHHQGTCQSAVPFSFLSYMRQFDLKTKHLKKINVPSTMACVKKVY